MKTKGYYMGCSDHAAYVQTQLLKIGKDKDWEVVIASDLMLMLDFDEQIWRNHFLLQLELLEQRVGQTLTFTETPSRSGHKHVVVHLIEAMDIKERIAWQLALGSDPKREALHLIAVAKEENNPIVLVMPRVKNLLTEGDSNEKPSDPLFAAEYSGPSAYEAFQEIP
jgi:hypothetical protein